MPARAFRQIMIAALAGAAVVAGAPSQAAEISDTAPVPDAELDQMRGGFMVDGIEFGFGALLQTMVNGQLAYQTQVTWTAQGAQVTTTSGPNGVVAPTVTNGTINGLNLQGFSPSEVMLMNNGATALIHKVTGGAVENIVVNAANNQTITQNTQLQLTLPNFAQTQALFQQNLAISHLMSAAQTATIIGH